MQTSLRIEFTCLKINILNKLIIWIENKESFNRFQWLALKDQDNTRFLDFYNNNQWNLFWNDIAQEPFKVSACDHCDNFRMYGIDTMLGLGRTAPVLLRIRNLKAQLLKTLTYLLSELSTDRVNQLKSEKWWVDGYSST